MSEILWEARKQACAMERYMAQQGFDSYAELHHWSISKPEAFWSSLLDFFEVRYDGSPEPVLNNRKFLDYGWFPNLRLNYAEHLLAKSDHHEAICFQHESGLHYSLSWKELRDDVGRLQRFLEPLIQPGDVVAAFTPNLPETLIAMLATSALGGIFTSTSADFGTEAVLDRFGQTRPKVLLAATSYSYKGKHFDLCPKIRELQEQLPSLKATILIDFLDDGTRSWPGTTPWAEIQSTSAATPSFRRLPFAHPLYIMYSSGTTGKPKCIVHSAGGVLLQHLKELALHSNISEDKTVHFFSTCAWMMWNWVSSSLALGARLAIYEGAPSFEPYLCFLKNEEVSVWGTSPKYLRSLEQSNTVIPPLPALETILSTGAPLLPEQYDYVYDSIKSDVQLSSISGGTDILGCFALGNPLLPVRRGELQCIGLGMDVIACDAHGQPVVGETGELLCRQVFPSMPVAFWDDPDQSKYRAAYFAESSDSWQHGDFIRISPEGTVRILGRSDATLNPGGVRIGTAEIYRQVERLPYVKDSIAVGKRRGGDVDIILFLQMQDDEELTDERTAAIKAQIRDGCTPRHQPQQLIQVPEIPYTPNGKKLELLVSRLVNGDLDPETLTAGYSTWFLSGLDSSQHQSLGVRSRSSGVPSKG